MEAENFYHIYNRGNNRQAIFLKRENYLYFVNKIRNHLLRHIDILAYCLMPNHFHLLAYSKPDIEPADFSNDLRIMLSSYTRAINKQENWVGSLFQQNTKIKNMADTNSGYTLNTSQDYPFICFHYIHQNPLKAQLVKRMEDWEMSSFRDYAELRDNSLVDKDLAIRILDIPSTPEQFIKESYAIQIVENIV